jgi:DNA-binding transcriptional LysR family regulator
MLISRDWELLRVLYECKNITQAARRLYISQPALTKRIMHIEEEMGIQLINRSVKGVSFTPQGEALVEYSKNEENQYELLKERLTSDKRTFYGTLRIGSVSAIAQFVLPNLLECFTNKYPDIRVEVHCSNSFDILEKVHSQTYHVGFVRDLINWKVKSYAFHEGTAHLVSTYPIEFSKLPRYPRIAVQSDSFGRRLIEDWWYDIFSEPPNIIMTVRSGNECMEMIKHGLGYGIMIEQNFFEEQSDLICKPLHYKNGDLVSRKDYMVFQDSKKENSLPNLFIEYGYEYFFGREYTGALPSGVSFKSLKGAKE